MSSFMSKQNMSTHELQLFQSEMLSRRKASGTAWLLWAFTGGLGGHRFYLGKTGSAIAMFFTAGGLGLWTLVDVFLLSGMIDSTNEKIEMDVIQEIQLYGEAAARDNAPGPALGGD